MKIRKKLTEAFLLTAGVLVLSGCRVKTKEATTTTTAPTATVVPTTTEVPTTTKVPTTTEIPTTTEVPTTTKTPTTTEVPTTTEIPTTTEVPTTTEAKYTITFVTNCDETLESITGLKDSSVTLPVLTREGYDFNGWYQDEALGEAYTSEVMPDHDVTLYASWIAHVHKITFNANGGDPIEELTVSYGETIPEIGTPTRTGYTFSCWSIELPLTMPDYDIKLTAYWNPTVYTITYVTDGGTTSSPETYTIENKVTLSSASKEGYKFAGWYTEDTFETKVTEIEKGSTGNKTFYAKYAKVYTITYHMDGGTTTNPTTYTELDTITLNTNASKDYYVFAGWYIDSALETKADTTIPAGSTGDKEYYAKWTAIEACVTYHLNTTEATYEGVAAESEKTVWFDEGVGVATLYAPVREGYTLVWCSDEALTTPVTSIPAGTTKNQDLYARWDVI